MEKENGGGGGGGDDGDGAESGGGGLGDEKRKMVLVWVPVGRGWLFEVVKKEEEGGGGLVVVVVVVKGARAWDSRKVARVRRSLRSSVGATLLLASPWVPERRKVLRARERHTRISHRLESCRRIR